MSTSRRTASFLGLDDALFAARRRRTGPHVFVLDAIAAVSPVTRSMFGCLAVYVGDKIVLILRDRRDGTADNGSVARHYRGTPRESASRVPEHAIHSGIRQEGNRLAGSSGRCAGFEEAALRACELILARDPRIGKAPGARRASGSGARKAVEILEAGEGAQERREKSRKFVTSSVRPQGGPTALNRFLLTVTRLKVMDRKAAPWSAGGALESLPSWHPACFSP